MMKASVVTLGLMVGFGLGVPLVAWYANQPPASRAVARTSCGLSTLVVARASPLEAEPELATIEIEQVVLFATLPRASARHIGEVRCSRHTSVTFAGAPVRVCDMERPHNSQRGGLLTPRVLPARLAPRDLPSPTGLLVEGRTSDHDVEIFGGPTTAAH